jgi:hypothetical protein
MQLQILQQTDKAIQRILDSNIFSHPDERPARGSFLNPNRNAHCQYLYFNIGL